MDIDFTTNTALLTNSGSTLTNNGTTLIGMDSDSIGLYAIDLTGYIINSITGIIEIANAIDTLILFTDLPALTIGRNANDGIFLNNGQMTLFASQLNAVAQGDSPSQIKGKYRHVLKKRPPPNPGRDFNAIGSFLNEALSLLRASGIIESDLSFLNGGVISPDLTDGDEGIIIFDGDENFQNVTLEINVNGKALKGADYDLIASIGVVTLGGDLNIDFNYTTDEGGVISFIEATSIVGTFNNPTLPADWMLRYNYPNPGNVSVQFWELLSLDENALEDIVIFNDSKAEELIIEGVLLSRTAIEFYDIQGRLILTQQLDVTTTQNNINVSKFSIGSYIVKLKSEFNGNKTQKLILN